MADYDWFDRGPTEAETEARKWRGKGFYPVFSNNSVGRINGIEYYLCRRGCGCLVFDPEAHIENVCTTFEPVVGNG